MKDIKCKCSHLKSEHHKFLWNRSYCNNCPCNNYLRHDSPTLSDKLLTVVSVGMIIVFSSMAGSLWLIVDSIPEEDLDKPMPDYTIRNFVNYDVTISIFVVVMLIGLVFVPVITDYFKSKKRRNFNDETV